MEMDNVGPTEIFRRREVGAATSVVDAENPGIGNMGQEQEPLPNEADATGEVLAAHNKAHLMALGYEGLHEAGAGNAGSAGVGGGVDEKNLHGGRSNLFVDAGIIENGAYLLFEYGVETLFGLGL